ncbi:hypothetical protein MNBD_UNCLBAC01-1060 [hydrothermal vent metagenome]|uniref:Uncharacterized protein n=1 Tax=hydrothermal vent metagenome TaxID=652676 RepID=A0A3B1DIH2_9ZZZZ
MLNIGISSGEILELFDEIKGPLTEKEIEVQLKASRESILMSLGWLIREGFITTECVGKITFFKCINSEKKQRGKYFKNDEHSYI